MSRIDDVLTLARKIRRYNLGDYQHFDEYDLADEIDMLQTSICADPQMLRDNFILELADEIYLMMHELDDLQ